MTRIDLYAALNMAGQAAGNGEAVAAAQDLCALRGQDAREPVNIAGATAMPRWHAVLAELIMLKVILP